MSNVLLILAIMGILQGLAMKFSKKVQDKLRLNAEGINKKYVNFKVNSLILIGMVLLVTQVVSGFKPELEEKMNILFSAFLLLYIITDLIHKKTRNKQNQN
ncbi:hypothetical protein [Clostridium sp. DJ247]|uniref:hypothetical protein n=1 Tax=Clostridium sp. DJ247 TaxID=2726188 RepID=UPI001625309E|nr:hypothetical protein [Clostridium sp. DJ247]MBC2581587.1 hypothetical protein [Clostridium sp. DJ247]